MRPPDSVTGTRCTRCTPDFEFQPREHPFPRHADHGLSQTAKFGFGIADGLHLPAARIGITLIHAQQVGGEQPGLIPASAGAQFDQRRARIGTVARQQRNAQALFQFRQFGL